MSHKISIIIPPQPVMFGPVPVSRDGSTVLFMSRDPHVAEDTNAAPDVYVKNLGTGKLTSATFTAAGTAGAGSSSSGQLSADGRWVAFDTFARDVSNSTGSGSAVMAKDLATGKLHRVDRTASGVDANGGGGDPTLSADGRYVAFVSYATNLVPGDTNASGDMFVKDLVTGALVIASTSSAGQPSARGADAGAISGNGQFVAFTSTSVNLHPAVTVANGYNLFLKNLTTGELSLVSASAAGVTGDSSSEQPTISHDGRYVTFSSYAKNLVPNTPKYGGSQIYWKDTQTGNILAVSSDAYGVQAANGSSNGHQMSADGRFIVFSSSASNLVPGDTNGVADVFIKDMLSGAIRRLSVNEAGVQGNRESALPSISAGGDHVTFRSAASNLVTGDVNGVDDTFMVRIGADFLQTSWIVTTGTDQADTIRLGNANDHVYGLRGNDVIDGGGGIDTAILRGNRANYTITIDANGATVSDHTGFDGTDTLTSVERLHFADATIALDINGNAGQAYRLYQAAFNRVPDKEGLGFWIQGIDNGATLDHVANEFMNSAEFKLKYGENLSNAALVDMLYQNVLHRKGEAQGVEHWNHKLDNNLATRAQVLAMFSESPENQAALIGVIGQGITFTPYF